jgi:hypothetical protein
MRKPTAPCKDCEYRHGGCHTDCERYQRFVSDNTKWLEDFHQHRAQIIALEQMRSMRIRSIAQKSPHR